MKSVIRSAAIAGALALTISLHPAIAGAESSDPVLSALEELKKGQEELRKEIAEIRKLVTPPPAPATIEKLMEPTQLGSLPTRGDKNARLTIIEFSDYQCPYCKRHVDQTLPKLLAEYVDTGKARYAFRDYPLEQIHPLAAKAAEAARCAGDQGRYWEMHDRLFSNQKELEPSKLPAHAQALGLEAGAFKACLDDSRYAKSVQVDQEAGAKVGARGTPMFVVGIGDGDKVQDGVVIHGAQSFAAFKAEIDKLLASPSAK